MRDPYTCPRCGLTTHHKTNIKKHFYENKKPCPASRNKIELTEEVKNYILENRIYHAFIPDPRVIKCKSASDLLQKFSEHKQIHINTLEESILAIEYVPKIRNTLSDLNDIVNNATRSLNERDLNIFIEKKSRNTIEIKETNDPNLKSMYIDSGVNKIVSLICSLFHLERDLVRAFVKDEQEIQPFVEAYYFFLFSQDIQPAIRNLTDNEILYDDPNNSYSIVDSLMRIYKKVKETSKASDIRKQQTIVKDIIIANGIAKHKKLQGSIALLYKNNESFYNNTFRPYCPATFPGGSNSNVT